MEQEAPPRRSVAELAGRFTGAQDVAADAQEKPVRRRPPRSLQLPKTQEDNSEPPGLISPLHAKAKRNSAIIEKLQANLALSPTALLPSPKSPGLRLLSPAFTLPSPGSTTVTMVPTPSSTTPTSPAASPLSVEEGPASFETPATGAEGSVLQSINKGRARVSIRRRPPSRRHRKSSSGEDVGGANKGEDAAPGGADDDAGQGDIFDVDTQTQEDMTDGPEKREAMQTDGDKEEGKIDGEDQETREEKVEEREEDSKVVGNLFSDWLTLNRSDLLLPLFLLRTRRVAADEETSEPRQA